MAIKMVVGLGNPGAGYQKTRHNVGQWFIAALQHQYLFDLTLASKFYANIGKCNVEGDNIWLLTPDDYMNLSGKSVAALAGFYKINADEILVAHDELDLPPGVARLKAGGGHGGHNGLKDIINKIGSRDFLRLRIGIGHPGLGADVSSYVLSKPPVAEKNLMLAAIDNALDYFAAMVSGNHDKVMNNLNKKTNGV